MYMFGSGIRLWNCSDGVHGMPCFSLFYMKTRGLSPRIAQNLLMHAFVADVINTISLEPYKHYVNFLVNRRLNGDKVEGLCAIKVCPSC